MFGLRSPNVFKPTNERKCLKNMNQAYQVQCNPSMGITYRHININQSCSAPNYIIIQKFPKHALHTIYTSLHRLTPHCAPSPTPPWVPWATLSPAYPGMLSPWCHFRCRHFCRRQNLAPQPKIIVFFSIKCLFILRLAATPPRSL